MKKTTVKRKTVEKGISRITDEKYNYKLIEGDLFTKFYHAEGMLSIISNLTPNGCKLFMYLLLKINKGMDTIILDASVVAPAIDLSQSRYYAALTDVIDMGILCKKSVKTYWINPVLFFNGDRKTYVLENVNSSNITYVLLKTETVFTNEVPPGNTLEFHA